VLSDFIVLWRMCILYEMHLAALVLTAVLSFGSLGKLEPQCICNANLITVLGIITANLVKLSLDNMMINTSDVIAEKSIFGSNNLGLASLYVSFLSNLCATVLIGYKAW
jgi:hypothetical protein